MKRLSTYSWIIVAVVLLIGFLFLMDEQVDYGYSFFIFFPISLGFAMGTLEKKNRQMGYAGIGLVLFLGFLVGNGWEGMICVLMAMPLFLIFLWIGIFAQRRIMKKEAEDSQKLMFTLAPLLILLLANTIERMVTSEPQLITIETAVELDYTPDQVFDQVKAMDKLDAEEPLGLWLGLPTPYKCELEADSVGAKRICHFSNGNIIAQVTEFKKGEILKMDVVDYSLTGREWFEFVDASYTFKASGTKTTITRNSSYKSILHPRWYWEPLEKWGIAQEHDFVLASLKKNLQEKYGR
jgi:hypothetical protein